MTNSKNSDRVGIIMYGYGLGNSPSLINAGKYLAANGYNVDYYTYNTFIGDLEFEDPKIKAFLSNISEALLAIIERGQELEKIRRSDERAQEVADNYRVQLDTLRKDKHNLEQKQKQHFLPQLQLQPITMWQ